MPVPDPDWHGAWKVMLFSGAFAALGRAARWARKERLSWRRWSWRVLTWECALVLFSGFVGSGIAKVLGWEGEAAWMVPALLAYFGPEFIEDLVLRFRDRELPPPATPPVPPAPSASSSAPSSGE